MACEATQNYSKLTRLPTYVVPEIPQMTVLNLVLEGTIFTEGGHYSPVNNVWGDTFGGDTVHYDTV